MSSADEATLNQPQWRVLGTYFESCNCDAICPCRSVRGAPGGSSTYGTCFGTLSWHVDTGHSDDIDLSDLDVVMSLHYTDNVTPSTPWDVVLYIDESADDAQLAALANIFLGRAGGSVANLYGPAIGTVHAIRRAHITVEHVAARKRIDVVGFLEVVAHGEASEPGDVRCGIPGFDHPGTELLGETLRSDDPHLRWAITGKRNAAFSTEFEYRS